MKIIDFHTHIFPPYFIKERQSLLSGEPGFSLLYSDPGSKMRDAEDLIRSMDDNGIDISVAVGFPWKSEKLYRSHNDYLLEIKAKYSDRIKVMACFDLFSPSVPFEYERCLKGGIDGAGELAFYTETSDMFGTDQCMVNLKEVMNLSLKNNLPVLLHSNEAVGHRYPGKGEFTLVQAYETAKNYPDNKIVFAHWGGGLFFYNLMKKETANTLKNIYIDTAASPFLYKHDIYRVAAEIFGADKILFGSDYPLISPQRYFSEMSEAGISENDLILIKGKNAEKMLCIE